MGKPTGFMEVDRVTDSETAPLERVKNWREFKIHSDEKTQRAQGSRCMDCGTPFCHTGHMVSGMASGCPVNNLIPEWNDLIFRGRWKEALHRLHKTNNFPEFTGRVCPAPCEGSCVLSVIEPAVTIKNNECAIIDRGWEEGWLLLEFLRNAREKKSPSSVPVLPVSPARTSSIKQATMLPFSNAKIASAACSCMAFLT